MRLDTLNATVTTAAGIVVGQMERVIAALQTTTLIQPVSIVGTVGSVPVTISNMPAFTGGGMPGAMPGNVALANGPSNPAFFQTQAGAEAWERKMAPKNAAISSMTSNSSEFAGGGGGNTFNINVTGGGNASETAELVAQEIVTAIQKSTYNELYTT